MCVCVVCTDNVLYTDPFSLDGPYNHTRCIYSPLWPIMIQIKLFVLSFSELVKVKQRTKICCCAVWPLSPDRSSPVSSRPTARACAHSQTPKQARAPLLCLPSVNKPSSTLCYVFFSHAVPQSIALCASSSEQYYLEIISQARIFYVIMLEIC